MLIDFTKPLEPGTGEKKRLSKKKEVPQIGVISGILLGVGALILVALFLLFIVALSPALVVGFSIYQVFVTFRNYQDTRAERLTSKNYCLLKDNLNKLKYAK